MLTSSKCHIDQINVLYSLEKSIYIEYYLETLDREHSNNNEMTLPFLILNCKSSRRRYLKMIFISFDKNINQLKSIILIWLTFRLIFFFLDSTNFIRINKYRIKWKAPFSIFFSSGSTGHLSSWSCKSIIIIHVISFFFLLHTLGG